MRKLFFAAVLTLIVGAQSARATTDAAHAESIYFSALDIGFTSDGSGRVYAEKWKKWLQLHRAIEKSPQLRAELRKKPASNWQDRSPNISTIYERLSEKFIAEQPTHVYLLQIAAFSDSRNLARFLGEQRQHKAIFPIYDQTHKDFKFLASTESDNYPSPFYTLPRSRQISRVCYGLYASRRDAARDAARLQKAGFTSFVRQSALTPEIAIGMATGIKPMETNEK